MSTDALTLGPIRNLVQAEFAVSGVRSPPLCQDVMAAVLSADFFPRNYFVAWLVRLSYAAL